MWDDEKNEEIEAENTEMTEEIAETAEETVQETIPDQKEPSEDQKIKGEEYFMKKFEEGLQFYARGGKSPEVAARVLKEYRHSKA